jgi:hypothetical protein
MKYVGKTTSKFKDRATAHRFSVDNKKSCPISDHFNLPGHSMSNMIFFAFEKVLKDDPFIIVDSPEEDPVLGLKHVVK